MEALAIVLLAALLLTSLSILFVLRGIRNKLVAWHNQWAANPQWASDYHLKEVLKTAQEIAHYAAMRHMREENK